MTVDEDGTNALLACRARRASVRPSSDAKPTNHETPRAFLKEQLSRAKPDRDEAMDAKDGSTILDRPIPELWEWAEYYCPWCYIAAVRLHHVAHEYDGRVRFRTRSFPLELVNGEAAPRDILEQEWWLAAIQEPRAALAPYRGTDWPTTTLPAFEAAWCAAQQGPVLGAGYDLRIRRAFFAEGRNIGRPEVLFDLAREAELDLTQFRAQWDSGAARVAVLTEAALGKERCRVRGTPTLTLEDGTHLRLPMAFPRLENRRIVGLTKLPCVGATCDEMLRALFERALTGSGIRAGQATT
jgi:predicted DsbA family dithiol-disulfide isomerase